MGTDSGESKTLLDKNVLNELKLIMEDEFTDVLHVFLEESIELMSNIHQAFEESPEDVGRMVHALKSCCNNVGATQLGEIAENIRINILNKDNTAAKDLLNELEEVYTETHAQVKKYIKENMDKVA